MFLNVVEILIIRSWRKPMEKVAAYFELARKRRKCANPETKPVR